MILLSPSQVISNSSSFRDNKICKKLLKSGLKQPISCPNISKSLMKKDQRTLCQSSCPDKIESVAHLRETIRDKNILCAYSLNKNPKSMVVFLMKLLYERVTFPFYSSR